MKRVVSLVSLSLGFFSSGCGAQKAQSNERKADAAPPASVVATTEAPAPAPAQPAPGDAAEVARLKALVDSTQARLDLTASQLSSAQAQLAASEQKTAAVQARIAKALGLPAFDLGDANQLASLEATLGDRGAGQTRADLAVALGLPATTNQAQLLAALKEQHAAAELNAKLRQNIEALSQKVSLVTAENASMHATIDDAEKALRPLLGAGFKLSSPDDVAALATKLRVLDQAGADTALRNSLSTSLGLPAGSTSEAILAGLQKLLDQKKDLGQQAEKLQAAAAVAAKALDDANHQIGDLQKRIEDLNRRLADLVAADALQPFAGIWLADDNNLPAGLENCAMMVRISASPNRYLRAVVCLDGRMETSSLLMSHLGTGLSPFPGAITLTTGTNFESSSCKAKPSIISALDGFAFDLRSTSGGEAATIAYSRLASNDVTFVSGSSRSSLRRNKDCSVLVQRAARPAEAANSLLQMAARVCQAETQKLGCFTDGGYVANSTTGG